MSQPYAPPAGLCESCANVRVVDTRRGSRFYLCQLSETDPRFPKYPRTPVLRCRGYVPAGVTVDESRVGRESGDRHRTNG